MSGDFLSKYYQEQEQRKAKAKADILAKSDALKAADVLFVVVEFSGSGDDGSINEVRYYNASTNDFDEDGHGASVPAETLPAILQLDGMDFDSLLPDGYEINDGGQGTLVFDVAAKTITINMGWNYTETRDEVIYP